jgi:hypothetical protein
MLSCKDATRLISQSMDASLPITKRISVRIHLLTCIFCTRYEQQLRLIRETLRRISATEDHPEWPAGENLSPEARDRIKKSLRNP